VRGSNAQAPGSGVGLTIARMLTDLMGGEMRVSSTPGVGSQFRIRLFLPRLAAQEAYRARQRARPVGYVGVRRRILIVDNEKVDREMLASLLEALGFITEQAGSGEECLALLPGFAPHLLFMDLAMPGIDGWETLRRLRRGTPPCAAQVAVLSANAFDRNLGNDVELGPEDFIVKPFKIDALLGWMGRKLGLEWVSADSPPPETPPAPATRAAPPPLIAPGEEHLAALDELIGLGYLRGILGKLAEIERLDTRHAEFVRVLRDAARQFQFTAMQEILRKSRHESP
jgi:CheY-like chemotaxis protein